MNMKEIGSDYTLERWLAIILSLLFLLPWITDAQPLPSAARDDAALASHPDRWSRRHGIVARDSGGNRRARAERHR